MSNQFVASVNLAFSCLPKNDVVNHLLKSLPKTDIGMAEQIDIIGCIAHDHLK